MLLPHNINYWLRINIQHSMLAHPVPPQYYNTLIERNRRWNKYQTLYVSFPLENHWLNIKEVKRDIEDKYVGTYLFFKWFHPWIKELKYSRKSMLDFPLLCVLPQNHLHKWSINFRRYMLDHPIFPYHYNSLIWRSRRWKK